VTGGGAGSRRVRALLGFAVGILLLASAVWVVASRHNDLGHAMKAVRSAPRLMVGAAVVLPVLNNLVIAMVFLVLTRRYGRVGGVEMCALIAAAWLLNYLPLRPGLFGRVAYHRMVNGIRVRDSIRVMIGNVACGGVAVGAALLVVAVAGWRSASGFGALAGLGSLLVVLTVAALLSRGTAWGPSIAGVFLRYVDLMVWVGRYAIVFSLVGSPIDPLGAVAVASVCQAALLVPFVGNGLGIREWAVGLTAAALPAAFLADGAGSAGLLADLVNRVAEVVAAVPAGLIGTWWLGRLRRRSIPPNA
jgi:hypothetical protein